MAATISFPDALASLCCIKCKITVFFPHHKRAISLARFSFLQHLLLAASSTYVLRSQRRKSRRARCSCAPSVRDAGKPLPSSKFVGITNYCVVEPCAANVWRCAECRFSFVRCSALSSLTSWSSPCRACRHDAVVEAPTCSSALLMFQGTNFAYHTDVCRSVSMFHIIFLLPSQRTGTYLVYICISLVFFAY
jgi:hypothetical protein